MAMVWLRKVYLYASVMVAGGLSRVLLRLGGGLLIQIISILINIFKNMDILLRRIETD